MGFLWEWSQPWKPWTNMLNLLIMQYSQGSALNICVCACFIHFHPKGKIKCCENLTNCAQGALQCQQHGECLWKQLKRHSQPSEALLLFFFFQFPNKNWLLYRNRGKNTILVPKAAYYRHLNGAFVNDLIDCFHWQSVEPIMHCPFQGWRGMPIMAPLFTKWQHYGLKCMSAA